MLVISKYSSIAYIQPSETFTCIPITSVENKGAFAFKIMEDNISPALPKQSYLLSDYIFTISKRDAVKKIGTASEQFYQKILDSVTQKVI